MLRDGRLAETNLLCHLSDHVFTLVRKLEQRQAVLFRLVDVGAELFAMSAAISQADAMTKAGNAQATEVAAVFCRHARRRVDDLFRATFNPDDGATYRLAQEVMAAEHTWIEEGMVRGK